MKQRILQAILLTSFLGGFATVRAEDTKRQVAMMARIFGENPYAGDAWEHRLTGDQKYEDAVGPNAENVTILKGYLEMQTPEARQAFLEIVEREANKPSPRYNMVRLQRINKTLQDGAIINEALMDPETSNDEIYEAIKAKNAGPLQFFHDEIKKQITLNKLGGQQQTFLPERRKQLLPALDRLATEKMIAPARSAKLRFARFIFNLTAAYSIYKIYKQAK